MSVFATVFLGRADGDDAAQIAGNIGILLQSISPDADIPQELNHVRASNLSHGTNMVWVHGDLGREATIQLSLRDRLRLFEPRFEAINGIDVSELAERNQLVFRIRARMRDRSSDAPFLFETRMYLLNQVVHEGRP